jgi:hypothetical protein
MHSGKLFTRAEEINIINVPTCIVDCVLFLFPYDQERFYRKSTPNSCIDYYFSCENLSFPLDGQRIPKVKADYTNENKIKSLTKLKFFSIF